MGGILVGGFLFPKGPCTRIVYTLAPEYLYYIGSTLRPEYVLLGYMDPRVLWFE